MGFFLGVFSLGVMGHGPLNVSFYLAPGSGLPCVYVEGFCQQLLVVSFVVLVFLVLCDDGCGVPSCCTSVFGVPIVDGCIVLSFLMTVVACTAGRIACYCHF